MSILIRPGAAPSYEAGGSKSIVVKSPLALVKINSPWGNSISSTWWANKFERHEPTRKLRK